MSDLHIYLTACSQTDSFIL